MARFQISSSRRSLARVWKESQAKWVSYYKLALERRKRGPTTFFSMSAIL
jgi:hypothetical protein